MSGYFQSSVSSSARSSLAVRIKRVQILPNITLRQYLNRFAATTSAGGFTAKELATNVIAIQYDLEAWAPKGAQIDMRFRLYNLKSQELVTQHKEMLVMEGLQFQQSGRELPNARELVLLHRPASRDEAFAPMTGKPTDTCSCSTFLFFPRGGRFEVTAEAFRHNSISEPIVVVQSEPFSLRRSS